VHAFVVGHREDERPVRTNGDDRLHSGRIERGLVLFAEPRGHVHDPGAVVGGDEVRAEHLVGARMSRVVGERRRVAAPHQVAAPQGRHDDGSLGTLAGELRGVRREPGSTQDVALGGPGHVGFHDDVLHVRTHGNAHIGGQRPGGGGPDQHQGAGQLVGAGQSITHRQRWILTAFVDVVVHPQLMVGQRRLVVPAVGQDPESFIDQTLVVELLEGPDHALHVVRVERAVVVFEVDPASLAGDVFLPVGGVFQHRLAALVVEGADAELEDFVFGLDAQLAHCLELGRQPVGVPAEAAFDPTTAHGLVARHHVLHIAREQVPVVRESIGERRTVVEDELVGPVLTGLALLHAGRKGVVAVPVGQHGLFDRRECRRRGHGLGLGVGDLGVGHRLLLRFVSWPTTRTTYAGGVCRGTTSLAAP
jgi:hypothetical protein